MSEIPIPEEYASQGKNEPGAEQLAPRELLPHELLSEDAMKLYLLIRGGGGQRDTMEYLAEQEGFELELAIDEIRKMGTLDESNSDQLEIINMPWPGYRG